MKKNILEKIETKNQGKNNILKYRDGKKNFRRNQKNAGESELSLKKN